MNKTLICLSSVLLAVAAGSGQARQDEEEKEESCESPLIQQSAEEARRFCITGEGQDVGYSFSIVRVDEEGNEVGDPIVSRQNVEAPGAGLDSTQLRDKFAEELNEVLDVIGPGLEDVGSARPDKRRDNCLFVLINVLEEGETFVLKVGEAGQDADLIVDEEGVAYNPMIFRVPCTILEIPTLSPAGLAALSIVFLLLGGVSIRRSNL